uniref:Uncharacterized protein n=1 Tax=Setaria viridis TaxID=4556 RepID=A0A4V6D4W5_SETVI|nr:hypothetical protein SEVIR_6G006400v2 [Setaria viridis]
MPIEMPRGLPFAVDTWTSASSLKRHRFLTHAHRDPSPTSLPPPLSPPPPRSTPPASPSSSPSASSPSSTAPRSSSWGRAPRCCASPTPTATSPSPPSMPTTAQVRAPLLLILASPRSGISDDADPVCRRGDVPVRGPLRRRPPHRQLPPDVGLPQRPDAPPRPPHRLPLPRLHLRTMPPAVPHQGGLHLPGELLLRDIHLYLDSMIIDKFE